MYSIPNCCQKAKGSESFEAKQVGSDLLLLVFGFCYENVKAKGSESFEAKPVGSDLLLWVFGFCYENVDRRQYMSVDISLS